LWAVPGAILFGFGWVYPHFLQTPSIAPYLYASPLGLIPCPTLAAVTGIGLMTAGFGSLPWMLVIGAAGAFYGVVGALLLGVSLDWVLLAGAALMLLNAAVAGRARGA
jgi:hypothetical protein